MFVLFFPKSARDKKSEGATCFLVRVKNVLGYGACKACLSPGSLHPEYLADL